MWEPKDYFAQKAERSIRSELETTHYLLAAFGAFGLVALLMGDTVFAFLALGLIVALPVGMHFEHRQRRRKAEERDRQMGRRG